MPLLEFPAFPMEVSWGDGTFDSQENNTALIHTYPRSGEYTIRAEDARGCVGYANVKVVLTPRITGHLPDPLSTVTTTSYIPIMLEGTGLIEGLQYSLDGGQTWMTNYDRKSDTTLYISIDKRLLPDYVRGVNPPWLGVMVRVPLPGYPVTWDTSNEWTIVLDGTADGPFDERFSTEFSRNVASLPTPQSAQALDVPTGRSSEVISWIGPDPERAKAALEVEGQNSQPRQSVVSYATAVIIGG